MTMLSNVLEVLRPLLPELVDSLGDYLRQARQALERGDALVAADAAHAVRGAAMHFGLPAMAHAAGALEDCCRVLPGAPRLKERKLALSALAATEGELSALRADLKAVKGA